MAGEKERGVAAVLRQWSQESSLPVSSTMMAGCGGVPAETETVRETLWWKESLFGGRGRDWEGICLALRGRMSGDDERHGVGCRETAQQRSRNWAAMRWEKCISV